MRGRRSRSTSPTPVMVPPVPTPATNASTSGSCWRISGPVVRRCTSGFAGFVNCCGMYQSGCSASSSSARRMAPCMPFVSGVSSRVAPYAIRSARRSSLMVSGMVSTRRYPRTAATSARPMPVLPLVGSMIVPPGRKSPSRSACSIMARQMRSFTLPPGFAASSFAQISACRSASSGRRDTRTTGVDPIRSSVVLATWQGSGMNALCATDEREHIRRVCAGSIQQMTLVFPGALGDFLLALPTLRLLRRRYPGTYATLVVSEQLRALARLAGVAEQVGSLDDASAAWLFGGSTLPPWLVGRPAVFSWMGSSSAEFGARLTEVAGSARLLAVERGPDRFHAAAAYARAVGVRATRRQLAGEAGIAVLDSLRARTLV